MEKLLLSQEQVSLSLFYSQFDKLVLQSFRRIFHVVNPPELAIQIALSHRHTGMGLLSMKDQADSKYLASLSQMVAEFSLRSEGPPPPV